VPSILIVDDEGNIRGSLQRALSHEGYLVDVAATIREGRERAREAYDVVLLDVWFPEGNGLELLGEIHEQSPDTIVIMMSGHATVDVAVRATRLGAYDFLEKPISLERLLVLLRNASNARALRAENARLQRPWAVPLVGDSAAIRGLLEEIRVAGPSGARVLVQGENGTGKELVARALHAAGPRHDRPFVAVNCAAIPEELIESELFGHERGAFTGATHSRKGRFEEAHGGALFLDEVGDLSPRAQTKLLRVLQEGEFQRVGGSRTVRVDVRVIAATNRNLAEAARDGAFREDLYFRIAVIPMTVPPLRDRLEDLRLLVEHFARSLAAETGGRRVRVSAGALETMRGYRFPGNIRELRNLIERLMIMVPGPTIDAEHVRAALPRDARDAAGPVRLGDAVRGFEREQIEAALVAEGGNMTRAAQRLGIERSHLYKKMKRLGCRTDAGPP
jgi:two-component system nitrogen regulation response regulator NtrX